MTSSGSWLLNNCPSTSLQAGSVHAGGERQTEADDDASARLVHTQLSKRRTSDVR